LGSLDVKALVCVEPRSKTTSTPLSARFTVAIARPKPDEPRGTLKGVPIKVRIGNSNALRDVRLLSICTFAEIMSRENLRADISQIEIPQSSSLLPYRLPPGPCGFGCGNGSASAGVAAMTAMARIAAIIFWLPIALAQPSC
jgi:hypothetical protein